MKKTIVCLLMVLFFNACSGSRALSPDIMATLTDVKENHAPKPCADELAKRIEASSSKYRPQIGSSKRKMTIAGGVGTFVGVVGGGAATLISKDKNKAVTGAIASGIGGLIGLYQVIQGTKNDANGYVKDSGAFLAEYFKLKTAAGADVQKQKAAATKLFDSAGQLKSKYPEYAEFRMTDLCRATTSNL